MKLIMILSILAITNLMASETYSQATKLTLQVKDATVREVLSKIEENSEFFFLYNGKLVDVNRKISIDVNDQKINEILSNMFQGTDVVYAVVDRQIVLTNKANQNGFPQLGSQQQQKVSGIVTDKNGAPIPGANVVVIGTTQGVMTDNTGKYSIEVPKGAKSLKFSFIGMDSQEISIGTLTQIDVTMVESGVGLGEVVIVGYGTQRKSDLTGSVSSVKPVELRQMPTARVDQALQGRTAGVFVMNTDGSPGGNTIIRIRGFNSIMGGSEPLLIIDGLQGDNINSLNPNDIASLEILKDASATAIYGSRGANGVILITTKLGVKGKPVIDAEYNIGYSQLSHKLPALGAADFAKLTNKWRMLQTGSGNIPTPYFTDAQIANWEKNGGTDWQNAIYKIGMLQNANLAISGATDKLKYMVSLGYVNQDGIILKTTYNRISLRVNLTAEVTDWVDFGLNYSYTRESNNANSFKYDFYKSGYLLQAVIAAQLYSPTVPVYDENGNYSIHPSGYGGSGSGNPVAWAVEPIIYNPTYSSNPNLFLNFKILKGLSFKVNGGAVFTNDYFNNYFNNKTMYGLPNNGLGNEMQSVTERYQETNILTYDKTFGIHHLTLTGVMEQIAEENRSSSMQGKNFLVEQLNFDNMSGAQSITDNSFHNKRALLSYMGRINYSLMDKYLATFSYRVDGSSVFGKDNKWGYFPSGSLAWRISQEDFLKYSSLLNDLKLRVSYGLTGNQGINPYQSFARLGSGSNFSYPWNGGTSTDLGFGVSGLANTALKWETTAETDIGVDVSFFKGRLTSTVDVYRKVTKDLLMNRVLPGYVGLESVLDNVGSIQNQGLEIMIGGDPLVGKFNWNTSFNISINRNKVLDLGPDIRIPVPVNQGSIGLRSDFMFLQVGQPMGLMQGWKFLGLWRSDQEAEARSYGQLPGDPHYADIAGVDANGNIVPGPDGKVDEYDRMTIMRAFPKFTFGWTNVFAYKGFELSALIICSYGNQLLDAERIHREVPMQGSDPILMDYWTPENQNTVQPAMYDGKYREDQHLINTYLFGNDYGENSRFVEDASFIKLKTITLAYSFEQKLLKAIGVQKAKVYVSGTNLLTITKYKGYDPEVALYQGSDAGMGVDDGIYPPSKMYSFGINLTF